MRIVVGGAELGIFPRAGKNGEVFAFTPSSLLGHTRASMVYYHLLTVLVEGLEGDIAECGVYRGETSAEMCRFLSAIGEDKRVHLFDTFSGFPDVFNPKELELQNPQAPDWLALTTGSLACSLEDVECALRHYPQAVFHAGPFSETFPDFDTPLCFVHADADLYQSTAEIIELIDRLLVPGGRVIFDDYGDARLPGVAQAVDELLDRERYDFVNIPGPGTHQALAVKKHYV